MNTRSKIEGCNSPVALSVSFNQDASCFSVGRESGFSVFNSDPCHLRVSRELGTGIGIVQMTEKSNFIGIVGGGTESIFSQNKVNLAGILGIENTDQLRRLSYGMMQSTKLSYESPI